ncbi:MAG: anthranilate phosphoribosyltransferase [Actinobacteria bacterium]|nr:anthranilate phosphoribosyltransferase [Actinomycetota bacterium]
MADFSWPAVLNPLMAGKDIDRATARRTMTAMMSGDASDAQIAAFIVAIRSKGESVDEMTGLVDGMLEAAVTCALDVDAVDLVGTGGDNAGTFNISTTASFIAAGAGVKIAKHGNRAASSKTGSADLVAALGIDLELPPDATKHMIEEIGWGFFFAPRYHPSMRHVGPVRKQLGVRTVFNFLGPLSNPGRVKRAAVGVSDRTMAHKMIEVLRGLGLTHAFVVHGHDGLDEISTAAKTDVLRLVDGEITKAEFQPSDFGVRRATLADLSGGDPAENLTITRAILSGEQGPRTDVALVNACPAIVASGLAQGFGDAMTLAMSAIESGAAMGVVDAAVSFSRSA